MAERLEQEELELALAISASLAEQEQQEQRDRLAAAARAAVQPPPLEGYSWDARELEFSCLEWKDADAVAFAKELPLLRHVETLDLDDNEIGTRGFAALAAAIREGAAPALKKFVFGGGAFDGDSTALKEACKARGISFIRGVGDCLDSGVMTRTCDSGGAWRARPVRDAPASRPRRL